MGGDEGLMEQQVFTFDATVSLSLLFSVCTVIFAWWRTREERVAKQIADLRAEMVKKHAEHEQSITAIQLELTQLEQRLSSVPSTEMMHRLELTLVKMDGQIGKMDERLKPVAAITERMQELMIEQAKDSRK